MIFKDRNGKNLEVGQKVIYLDTGMIDGEIVEIEEASIMDGATGNRQPKIHMKIALNFPPVPPNLQLIAVGNVRVVEDAPAAKVTSIGNLTRH